MEQVIKTYLGIFLMMLLSTVGIGIVAAEAQICQARNFKSDVVVELENSNYNREVINACIKQADELGYQLQVNLYEDSGAVTVCENGNVPPVEKEVTMAEVILHYAYRMGPFHSKTEHSIRGFGSRFMRKIMEDYGQAIIYAVLGSGCIGVLWYLLGYVR